MVDWLLLQRECYDVVFCWVCLLCGVMFFLCVSPCYRCGVFYFDICFVSGMVPDVVGEWWP